MSSKRMGGMTLVELVIAIVIVSVALAGLVAAFGHANRASADPAVTQQMLAIAEGMMEEVLLKPYNVVADDTASPTRAQFNDVRDYDRQDDAAPGYTSAGIKDIDGDAIDGLGNYTVSVQVNATGVALDGVPAGNTLRIVVTVTSGAQRLALTGWRTNPWL